ncbi:MAG: HAD-IC family P-type ATPase, partial [Verrucomicrobia bacterium]|nr:HAD-IC family P-type ATPase [Verrucomicrobiota bacterium]
MTRDHNSPESSNSKSYSWHTLSREEILNTLNTTLDGLSSTEVAARQEKHGLNELIGKAQTPWWHLLLDQFKNVLIIVLLIATGLSAVLGHAIEAIAIAVIVLFAILLSFVQNYRAEKAIERLRHLAAPNAETKRSGQIQSIPARELVPGDLIQLNAGDRVPADARLISAFNLKIDESALTGESMPSEKTDQALHDADLPLGDQTNIAFSGTNVTYGRAVAIVTETGMRSQFGKIATLLDTIDTSQTPLQENLDTVGKYLAQAALVIVTIVGAIGIARGQPILDTLVFAIALAVAVVPEALPAVVTISLAIGVQHLIKRHALVRRLPAVETLGATSVICTDKTGTLTKDEMTVQSIYADGIEYNVSGVGYAPEGSFTIKGSPTEIDTILQRLLIAGTLSSDASLRPASEDCALGINGDPTEGALVVAAAKAGLDQSELNQSFPRVSEIPFTSETKRMTTIHSHQDHLVAFSKGAPEMVLPTCSFEQRNGGIFPMDENGRSQILSAAQDLAKKALRVLAIATKEPSTKADANDDQIFLGLVGMMDPPRSEAKE